MSKENERLAARLVNGPRALNPKGDWDKHRLLHDRVRRNLSKFTVFEQVRPYTYLPLIENKTPLGQAGGGEDTSVEQKTERAFPGPTAQHTHPVPPANPRGGWDEPKEEETAWDEPAYEQNARIGGREEQKEGHASTVVLHIIVVRIAFRLLVSNTSSCCSFLPKDVEIVRLPPLNNFNIFCGNPPTLDCFIQHFV